MKETRELDCAKDSIIKAINFIIIELRSELSTRTGFNSYEYKTLLLKLKSNSKLTSLNKDELLMIHQAINEVLYGIALDNLPQVIGLTNVKLEAILNQIDVEINQHPL